MSTKIDRTRLARRSNVSSTLVVIVHIGFVLAPAYLAAYHGPGWHLIPLWLWLGLGMNGLLNLLHECAHYHVFTRRRGSDVLGRWILGPMAVADFDGYRKRHWDHHRKLGQDDDPKTTYHADIRGWRWFAYLVRCLFLIEGLKRFSVQTHVEEVDDPPILAVRREPGATGFPVWLVRTALTQAAFAGSLFMVARMTHDGFAAALGSSITAYGFVYLYGLSSVTVFAAGLRAIAEHQIGADGAATVGRAALRNFSCNPVSRLILGAYGFGEHATHHQIPSIPYYHLVQVTSELAEEDKALLPRRGYLGTIWDLARSPSEIRA